MLKDLMIENIIYQKYNKKLQHHHQGKTLLWSANPFWYKTTWKN